MSKDNRKYILKHIEILSKEEQKELFKIVHTNKTIYTRNNNGVFVNLSWVSDNVIDKIYNYIKYCLLSHNAIENAERIQEEIKKNHINKNEAQTDNVSASQNAEINKTSNQQKNKNTTSTMKFYVARKRLSKYQTIMNKLSNDVLEYEL